MVEHINIGKIIGFALGIYVIAYMVLDAVLAVANKTGFQSNATLGSTNLYSLATIVLPILFAVATIWLLYKSSGLE